MIVIAWEGLNFQSVSMLLFQGCLIGEPATSREIAREEGVMCSPSFLQYGAVKEVTRMSRAFPKDRKLSLLHAVQHTDS